MATTANVLTGLGTSRIVYREFASTIGVLVAARSYPRMIDRSLAGTRLGLHDEQWVAHIATGSGDPTYYVRIEPIFQDMTDPDGLPLRGTPNTENTTADTTFDFDPFPDDYPCTGYRVYAGTVSGTLYLQGTLTGRFNTHFVMGSTFTYTSASALIDAQTVGVPAFVNCCEIYQAEGSVDARMFLGGGKKYSTGYARVAQTTAAPSLACDTAGSAVFGTWAAVLDGSLRMRIDNEWFEFTGISFNGDGSMANVATTLQAAIQASQLPKLISGSSPNTTVADWVGISDGSFNIVVNGTSYNVASCDFTTGYSGAGGIVASMVEVATEINVRMQAAFAYMSCRWDETAERFVIETSVLTGSDLITNGDMSDSSSWDAGTNWTVDAAGNDIAICTTTGAISDYLYQDHGTDMNGKKWTLSYKARGTGSYNYVYPAYGKDGVWTQDLYTSPKLTSFWQTYQVPVQSAPALSDTILFRVYNYNGTTEIDDVTVFEQSIGDPYLSYLARHSTAVGTDLSGDGYMSCRGDSAGVVLNRKGKDSSTHTVTWSTDHFVIAGVSTGDSYRLSLLESATADVGTDLSGSSWLNADSDSEAVYTPGKTTLRSVDGNGTDWGQWVEGMKFRALDQGKTFIVKEYRSATELILDSDYTGDGFDGWTSYILEPYGDQVYISALGNPFDFPTDNIVKLPTSNSDIVTAIKRAGPNIAVIMEHTTWLIDSVDVSSPRMVSPYYGAPSTEACISWENGVAFFTGEEFVFLKGGRVVSLDPEGRTRGLISRISAKTPFPHGVFLPDPGILMWWVGLDDSSVYNIAICYYPKTGAWWLYNHKNASASLVIWDDSGKPHLMTGSTYDDQHSIPAFTFLHSDDYKNDGASTVANADIQGAVTTIGAETTTSGYLTCDTAGTATYTDYSAVTDGYFRVTIDGSTLDVGPVDFGSVTDMDDVATALQTAIRAATGAGGAEVVAWSTDHFIITSGTETNLSDVSVLIPYFPDTTTTDLSSFSYLNGRTGYGTETNAVSTLAMTLEDFDGNAANLERTGDGEKGVYLFVCDTNGENGAYGRVLANTTSTVTITPAPATTPVAGWYWYMGGIVPSWTKWTDFGSPQHKQKVHGFSFSVDPNQSTSGNDRVFLHGMQDLSTTIRTTKNVLIGAATDDTTNVLSLQDQKATQWGFKFFRPSSVDGLRVQDFVITHRAVS